MAVCALCGREVEASRDMSRKASCPGCGGDLHICLNCRSYSETAHNKCIETRAEQQRHRDKANFCDYFSFGQGLRGGGPASGGARDEARRQLDDLFGKG